VVTEGFWNSLRYLAVTRLLIAGILTLVLPLYAKRYETSLLQDTNLFLLVAGLYVVFAVLALVCIDRVRLKFNHHLAAHIAGDLLFLSLVVFAAGGARSGFGLLMMAPVAGAAILVTPTWALFAAAIASVSLLGQSVLIYLRDETVEPGFFAAAATGATLFAVAFILNRLAARAAVNEARAQRRGTDLRNQLMINQMVIAELTDGVLIFNGDGKVRVMNRAAQQLLGSMPAQELAQAAGSTITGFLPTGPGWAVVAEQLHLWQQAGSPSSHVVEVGLLPSNTINHWQRRQRVRLRFLSDIKLREETAKQKFPSKFLPSALVPEAKLNGLGGQQIASLGPDFVLVIEDLDRIEQQAQQLKLASMGRLSASIAHEIRNPLGAIRHANGLLSESLGDQVKPAQQRLARIVEDNTVRINRIVEDILSIARRDSAQIEDVDLAGFLADFLPDFVKQQGCDDTVVRLELCSTEPIPFDPAHLHQILVNLLTNALRYATAKAGSVRVVWQFSQDRRSYELLVADDGPGVPSQLTATLFEPFATTDSKGTGLGLYLARELCSINEASLRYERLAERLLDDTKPTQNKTPYEPENGQSVDWSGYGAFVISVAMR
jgi:two-component system, NtrC family, sensor histidine kinase PilS